MNNSPRLLLTIVLKDGEGTRSMSCVCDWLITLARLDFARTLPSFKGFALMEVA